MPKYIDADKLCKALKELAAPQLPDKQNTILGVVSSIEHMPGADVAPIRRGKMVYNDNWRTQYPVTGHYTCTSCGGSVSRERGYRPNYCSYCGADVREAHHEV